MIFTARRLPALGMAILLVFFTLAPVAYCEEQEEIPAITMFNLKTLDGGEFALESRRGCPLTVVTFFATWSPRSATILKELEKLLEKLQDKGLCVVAVNSETEVVPADFDTTLKEYVKENGAKFTVVVDTGLVAYREWSIKAMPTTFLLDKELKVISYVPGAPSSIHDTLFESSLKALGLESEHPDADAAPTRYQANRHAMLNYGLAEKLLKRGSPHKALEKILEVIEMDPKFPDAYALMGVINLSISEDGETSEAARKAFAKAIELDPELPVALFGAAYFHALDGDSKTSIEKTKLALTKNAWGFHKKPADPKIAEYKALLDSAAKLLDEGKADEANTNLGTVLEDFVVVRKRVKVDMKRMREMEKKADTNISGDENEANQDATNEAKSEEAAKPDETAKPAVEAIPAVEVKSAEDVKSVDEAKPAELEHPAEK